MDPLVDLIRLLRPSATLWGGIRAAGSWGVSFNQREDLLFCWLETGECQLTRPDAPPLHLKTNDFVLIRTVTAFALVSDVGSTTLESDTLVAATRQTTIELGEGGAPGVVLHAGRFVFDTANEELLSGLLPSLIHVAATDATSPRLRSLLAMNLHEALEPRPGGAFVVGRLMELILIEILRNAGGLSDRKQAGLLAGLVDPVTNRALTAIHADVACSWTVQRLAHYCGVSRSTFATRFRGVVGTGPIEYQQRWRMALAKDYLRIGRRSIGDIAFTIGFQSASAFSTAFTRNFGMSPRRYADAMAHLARAE